MSGLQCAVDGKFPTVISETVKDAAINTFASILGAAPSYLADGREEAPCAGVVGVLSFAGELPWSFALVLPEPTAALMAKKFAGFDIPFDSPDMGDVVGELANVLAGDIAAKLDARGFKAHMSLPMVTRGHEVELLQASGQKSTRMGFASSEGTFWFKLVTAKQGQHLGRRPGT